MLEPEDLVQVIDGCRILVSNDYELDLILNKTGLKKEALLERARDDYCDHGRAWVTDIHDQWGNKDPCG